MLAMRPNCECCDRDLGPGTDQAFICSFECTFCETCASGPLDGVCPNCGGDLVRRPRRTGAMLAKYPATVERVLKDSGCTARA